MFYSVHLSCPHFSIIQQRLLVFFVKWKSKSTWPNHNASVTEFYWKYSLQLWTKHNREWKRFDPFPPLHSSCWKWLTPSLSKGYICFLEYGYALSRFSHFAEATWSDTAFYQLHEKVTFHFYFHFGLYTLPFLKDLFFRSHLDLEFGIKLLLHNAQSFEQVSLLQFSIAFLFCLLSVWTWLEWQ